MNHIHFDSAWPEYRRREALYQGDVFLFSPRPSTLALCELAREMSEEAFAPHHPRTAQFDMPVEKYVEILAELKPKFIHHPECKRIIPEILTEFGCDLNAHYFDIPRLRTVTSDGYLTSGLGYAFKPHRDTWYSPPMCQLNWWLPVYEIVPQNTMAFHFDYWDRAVLNSSEEFNYQDWQNTGRKQAASQVKQDTRRQAAAEEELDLSQATLLTVPPGGLMIFSAAHLHSTVPNHSGVTRFSVDFRTVHGEEARTNAGATNLDSRCHGTTIGDYLHGTDQTHVPAEIAKLYESGELENINNCETTHAAWKRELNEA